MNYNRFGYNFVIITYSKKLILKKNTISFANFQTSIDLSSVAQGIYFIKISANGQNNVKRVVKE